jgi:prophage antirepressor-like protein
VITNEAGDLYFVGKEVCSILGYSNVSKTLVDHCKGTITFRYETNSNGGNPNILIIPERDLYRLIMRSKKEEAEKFEEWVVGEVLPSIRKNGIYATDNVIDQILDNPDFGIELLTKLKEERKARVEAEKTVAILSHTNKVYTVTEIAKELGLKSAQELNKLLCEKGIQYKINNTFVPYSNYANLAYFDIKQEVLDNGHVIYHRKITQRGREFLINLISK